jgi:hypothetical protein
VALAQPSAWETQNIQISPAEFEPTVPVFEDSRSHFSSKFYILKSLNIALFRVDNINDLCRK